MIQTSRTQRAEHVPFSNSGTSFLESDVEGALLEVRKRVSNDLTSTETTASGTLTLTNTSNSLQVLTGTAAGFSVVLPDATTLKAGHFFEIPNTSNQSVTIKTNGGATLFTLGQTSIAFIRLETNGTAAGTWIYFQVFFSSLASGIVNYSNTSSTLFTTTSNTDVLITSFTITPQAGTYAVWSNLSASTSQGSRQVTMSLYKAGTAVTDSIREQTSPASNQKFTNSVLSTITVDGTQAIDVRVKVSASTLSIFDRTLLLIRLGT